MDGRLGGWLGASHNKRSNGRKMTNETWGQIRENLLSAVGKNNYKNWIEPLELAELEGGVATFIVPTNFMGNWVSRNFGDQILNELTSAGERVARVEFSVPTDVIPSKRKIGKPVTAKVASAQDGEDLPGGHQRGGSRRHTG